MNLGAWLADLASELAIAATDPDVWRALVVALATGLVCFGAGAAACRALALGPPRRDAMEEVGLKLGIGLVLVSVIWAAVRSGGWSAFTPIAVLFIVAIGVAGAKEVRRPVSRSATGVEAGLPRLRGAGHHVVPVVLTAAAIVGFGLMYGATMTPSPRDGLQPVEFLDEAFYSVLGRDLATTGVESIYSPAGFSAMPGFPLQTWYHWGELWLAAIPIQLVGLDPIDARHYVALPLLLVAGACLTASIVRRLAGANGRMAGLFGATAFLFLAPIPLSTTHFGSWPRGMVFGITMYGLAAVVVLIAIYRLVADTGKPTTRAQGIFDGALIGSLVPAHIVIAGTTFFGVAVGTALRSIRSRDRRVVRAGPHVPGFAIWTGITAAVAIGWGLATGHGIGTSGLSTSVAPFNASWMEAIAVVLVGGLPFLAIPLAWRMVPSSRTEVLFTTAVAATVIGGLVWGARLGDFTTFHAFYAPLAVLITPTAAVALVLLWRHLRPKQPPMAAGLVILVVLWLDISVVTGVVRLQEFGAKLYPPTPTVVLDAIGDLPAGALVAYACRRGEELAIWNPRLGSLDAHTGHHVVPMCFQAEFFPSLTGVPVDGRKISPLFEHAPQRELYPNSEAIPSSVAVERWMRARGVGYIYADAMHPNSLVPNARVVAEARGFRLLALD